MPIQEMLELEDAQRYKEDLDELTFNSRPHIIHLTELARDYGRKIPQAIVYLIEQKVAKSKVRIESFLFHYDNYIAS